MPDSQPTLEQHILRAVREEAAQMADAIRHTAQGARGNEAQLVMACDQLLADFAQRANLHWAPQGERRVIWQEEKGKRSGRIDRLFHRVVVEYEAPGSLYPKNEAAKNRHALDQVRNYMDALIKEEGWKSPSVAGVVTDGLRFIFCRYSAGQWVEEAPVDTSPASVARFLRLLLTFRRPPLLPDLLVQRFGAQSQVTVNTVRALYDALASSTALTNALFAQWQEFFADIAGLDPDRLKDKKELMTFARRVIGREAVDPARLLFALYTYSALLIKLLAVAAVTPFFDPDNPDRLADWAALDDEDLRKRLRQVESGEFFQRLGVRNFTEGDFFGWYHNEWTPSVARQVKQLLTDLSEFDPDAVEQAPERVRDLLKRLYHGLFPREVRHALGEYYTPDWLAERLLAQLDYDLFGTLPRDSNERSRRARRVARRLTTTRFLDPACGSGTFLVLILRRLRQWARECGVMEREQLLPALLENVVGFDLNPLAVISARANFLLAIADLLQPSTHPSSLIPHPSSLDEVELPIYLADSIVLPAEGQGETLFETKKGIYELPLRGVGRKFIVPVALAKREHLNTLARLLRRDVEAEVGADAFLRACEGEFALPAHEWRHCEPPLRELYETLYELHRDGRNGLWADIARNMFMPLFIPRADFVVGNPPWVNWENLPQEYRDRSKDLWQKYGLFVHGGMDTILGKGKKDVSTLLTYVAADLYLKTGGKLGFVITQSVFKTSGAGQGFRRFQLGEGEPLKMLAVDDFSAMQPFEGATNRTAVFVLQKGQPTTYPVSYNVWRKGDRTSVPFTATLDEALPLLTYKQFYAEPVDDSDRTSAWLSARREALRALRKVLGQSDYRAHAGAYSGGANAVYWLQVLRQNPDGTVQVRNITEGAKREIQAGVHTLEPDLLYPLLRGREVKKWVAQPDPDARFLIVQDPHTRRGIPEADLKKRCPRTFAYLQKYESMLRERAAFKRYFRDTDAFYSMFDISGEYTFAPYQVVWAEQGDFGCAVVDTLGDKPIVPDHKIMLLPFDDADEAHFVCALANSSPFLLAVNAYAIAIQQDPHIFQNVRIPRYDSENRTHRQLAELSRQAHMIASGETVGMLADVERKVDACAAAVWGLTAEELAAVQRSVRE